MRKIIYLAFFGLLITALGAQEINLSSSSVTEKENQILIRFDVKPASGIKLEEYRAYLQISCDGGKTFSQVNNGVEYSSPALKASNSITWSPSKSPELIPYLDPMNMVFRVLFFHRMAVATGISGNLNSIINLALPGNQEKTASTLKKDALELMNKGLDGKKDRPGLNPNTQASEPEKGQIEFNYLAEAGDKKLFANYRPVLWVSFDDGARFFLISPDTYKLSSQETALGKNYIVWNPSLSKELIPFFKNTPLVYRIGILNYPSKLGFTDIKTKDKLTSISKVLQDKVNAEIAVAQEARRQEAAARPYDWLPDAIASYEARHANPGVPTPVRSQPPAPRLDRSLTPAVFSDNGLIVTVYEVRRFRRSTDQGQVVQLILSMENTGASTKILQMQPYGISLSYQYYPQNGGGGLSDDRADGRLDWNDLELSSRDIQIPRQTKLWGHLQFQNAKEETASLGTLRIRYLEGSGASSRNVTAELNSLPIHPDRWAIPYLPAATPPATPPVPLVSPSWNSFPDWQNALEFHRTASRRMDTTPMVPQPQGPQVDPRMNLPGFVSSGDLTVKVYEASRYKNSSGIAVLALLISVQNTGAQTKTLNIAQSGINIDYTYYTDPRARTTGRSGVSKQGIDWIDRNLSAQNPQLPRGQEIWGIVYFTGADVQYMASIQTFTLNEGNTIRTINRVPQHPDRWWLAE